jgi:hypothetical protein
MKEIRISVQIPTVQQVALEVELQTLFGLHADDVFATQEASETILAFVLEPEGLTAYEQLMAYLTQKKSAEIIRHIEVTPQFSDDEDEANEGETERSPQEEIACAQSALTTLSQEWTQNVFGDDVTDVLFDALNELIDRRKLQSARHQLLTPLAQLFNGLWDDSELRSCILDTIRHERGREASVLDIEDVVRQVLSDAHRPLLQGANFDDIDLYPLVHFLMAYVGNVPLDPEYLEQNGYDPHLLQPRVTASCHSDDFMVEVKEFDATLWFAQAEDDELRALRSEGYSGNSASDSVAEFMATYDSSVQAMFDHNDRSPRSVELRGFECSVHEVQAEAWIAQHRPHLLAEEEGENSSC